MVQRNASPILRIRRSGRASWTSLSFLAIFLLLIFVLAYRWLPVALEISHKPSPVARFLDHYWPLDHIVRPLNGPEVGKYQVRAVSVLLLSILLIVLAVGVMISLRLSRMLFPRAVPKRSRTKYVDAWAESANRMPIPPPDNTDPPR